MGINKIDKNKYNLVEADNPNYQFMGRIDFENPKAPLIIFAGSTIKTRFSGTSVKIAIKNYHSYYENAIGYIIDNNLHGKVVITEHDKDIILDIADGLEDGIHELVLYKRSDATNYFVFYGVILDDNGSLLAPPEKSGRRIECYGDSVSAGEVSEAVDYVGKSDPENHEGIYSNAWYSYSMITARKLNAELNNIAQGGIAVMDGTGYFCPDYNYIGMESSYNNLKYNHYLGECTPLDFYQYNLHFVIITLG